MTPSRFRSLTLFVLAASASIPLRAQAPRRITTAVENGRRQALAGRVPRLATRQNDRGRVPGSFEVADLRLYLKPAGESALDTLLQEQQDPASPNYRKWLTPEQYGDRFGAAASDVQQIVAWLQSQGFTDIKAGRARTWIAFSGTADQVRNAFGTEIHQYSVNGDLHFANATDPSIPAAMANVVSGITGLHDFRMQPRIRKMAPQYNASGGSHQLAPDDIATIYNVAPLYQEGLDGKGVKIVVVGQTAIRTSDVNSFRNQFKLPAIDLTQTPVPSRRPPGVIPGDVDEAHLDIEWSGAVARNASIVYVYANSVWDSAAYAVDNHLGDVISMSYGLCENIDLVDLPTYRQTAQQANAQGMTWFAATGDSGAGDCEDRGALVAQNGFAVDAPSSIPEITGMGGTQFDDQGGSYWGASNNANGASALGYIPERVWNDGTLGQIGGGGGGASAVFPRPSWQTGPGVPAGSARLVPDLALSSSGQHVGYLVYSAGLFPVGGTSAAAPVMAGVAALLNQYLVSTKAIPQPGLSNINPTLYRIAASSTAAEVFHDIVNGDNGVACASGTPDCINGYFGRYAAPGYDMATGLGSINAYNLVHTWSGFPAASSAVVPTIDQNPVFQTAAGWKFVVTLTEEAGIGATLTDFTVDGVSQAARIPTLFSTTAIAARGSISATVTLTDVAAPKTVVLGFSGVDAHGARWSAQYSVPFQGPQTRLTVAGASNAASGSPVFAPGMIMSVYGTGMGNFAQSAAAIPLPEYLAGFEAWVDGVPAPIYYVSPNQVNIQIPYETLPGTATLELGNPFENIQYTFNVTSTGPGIFTLPNGRVNPTQTAARGQVATLFITGEGAVTPNLATGTTPSTSTSLSRLPRPRATVSVTVGGVPVPTLDFIGIPWGLVGVTQINFRLPDAVAPGEQPVVVTVGSQQSNTAKILVQ
jgi:uncharacterized protein (TIGR03437 family)